MASETRRQGMIDQRRRSGWLSVGIVAVVLAGMLSGKVLESQGLAEQAETHEEMRPVIAPIEDTPADRAGIKAGDRIVKIDGASTKDVSLMDAVNKMRGPKGTKVVLTVEREGVTAPFDVSLVREIIKIQSVRR